MIILRTDTRGIYNQDDITMIRQIVREWAVEMRFNLVDQTKLVTAASELARNTLVYGGGGIMKLEMVENAGNEGLRLSFEDEGPGITDIELAMKDGYTTGSGLGLGLSGAKRLVSEFEIKSAVGEGTRVSVTKWK